MLFHPTQWYVLYQNNLEINLTILTHAFVVFYSGCTAGCNIDLSSSHHVLIRIMHCVRHTYAKQGAWVYNTVYNIYCCPALDSRENMHNGYLISERVHEVVKTQCP